jgi:cardiolipin synthase
LDPLVDRLLVISGVVVCWHFDLLPRWALAVLVARELFMLGLVRWGLRHGADIKVNWLGRLGVWPVLSAIFFALAGLETLGEVLLYIGLAFVLAATVKYVRDGLASRPSSSG